MIKFISVASAALVLSLIGVVSADANTCSAYGPLTDSTLRTPDDAAESVTINPTPLLPPMYCDE